MAAWLGAASTWTEGRPLTTAVWLGAASTWSKGLPLTTAVWLGAASTWSEGLPLTTAVWLGAAGVVVVLGLLIGVASCCNHSIDEPQQTSVTELQSRRPGWH